MKPIGHFKQILLGITAFVSVISYSRYPNLSGGFMKDRSRLSSDVQRVTQQFNNQIKKTYQKNYGNQKHTS